MNSASERFCRSDDPTVTGDEVAPRLPTRPSVGRYELGDVLGAGSGGTVYEALDPDLDRRVAIKIIRVDDSQGRRAMRLVREAKALAQLSHPNIVTVLDAGRDGDHVFITMELIAGLPLDRWLASEPRELSEVIRVFIDAARGLQAAHDAGFVHRDFKPANTMVDDDGRVRVMDFGLAIVREGDELSTRGEMLSSKGVPAGDQRLTRTRGLVGTPGYMAPEQYARTEISAATDQFAWTIALYEALVGHPPFVGDTVAERCVAVLAGEFREPSATPGVARRAWPVLRRGLAVDPAHRWPSMDAMVEALQRSVRPRRSLWMGAAVLGLLTVAVAWPRDPTTPSPPRAPTPAEVHAPSVESTVLLAELRHFRGWLSSTPRVARDNEAALQHVQRLLERARDLEDPSAELEAILLQTELMAAVGRTEGRVAMLSHAWDLAIEADRPWRASEVALMLVRQHRETQRYDEAEMWLRRADRMMPDGRSEDLRRHVEMESALLMSAEGETQRAIEILERGLNTAHTPPPRGPYSEGRYHALLSRLYQGSSDLERAAYHGRRSYELLSRSLGDDDPSALAELLNLALLEIVAGKQEQGKAKLRRACRGLEGSKSHPLTIACWANLGGLEQDEGDPDLAVSLLQRALALQLEHYADDSDGAAAIRIVLSRSLSRLDRHDEAIEHLTLALATQERLFGLGSAHTLAAMQTLGEAHYWAGDSEAARSVFKRYQAIAIEHDRAPEEKLAQLWLALVSDDEGAVDRIEACMRDPSFSELPSRDAVLARFELARRIPDRARSRQLAHEAVHDAHCMGMAPGERDTLLEHMSPWLSKIGVRAHVRCP